MSDIDQVEQKRGYLLPYHRMLAAHDPELLTLYDAFYTRLTLVEKTLPPREKEIVWIALLAAAREGVGKLHLERGVTAGLSLAEIRASVALSAASESWAATAFAAEHWAEFTPPEEMLGAYRALVEAARGPIEPRVAELALLLCHAARAADAPMRHHLSTYFAAGGEAGALAEALAFLFLPMGANLLIEAVAIWAAAAPDLGIPAPY
ncbi:carboxymuconolactone decarboxylase family protein [Acuticoccus sediminis]|uniref:carboxymuconolactone decarboxylase family protein n=1 Tax=Acuticoccus sediminis TaxID=2184697 RepID=UPI001CFC74CB|nr:carboxymuconolactone decarboxylase family protein [Acuticoccus sediminis]